LRAIKRVVGEWLSGERMVRDGDDSKRGTATIQDRKTLSTTHSLDDPGERCSQLLGVQDPIHGQLKLTSPAFGGKHDFVPLNRYEDYGS
jgi:hypothetical protein